MKNKLSSLVAVPFFLAGFVGCYELPINRAIASNQTKTISNYLSNKSCDCVGLIIDRDDTRRELVNLIKIEEHYLGELKKEPKNQLNERDLKITQEVKKDVMNDRDKIARDITYCKCLNY